MRPILLVALGVALSGCTSVTTERRLDLVSRHAPAPTWVAAGQEFTAAEQHAAADPACFTLVGSGNSMRPLYPDRTAIVVREQSFNRLRPGMIVVYRNPDGRYIAHALVEELRKGWIAIGLNNAEPDDELVTKDNYVGVITAAFASSQAAPRPETIARSTLQDHVRQGVRTAAVP